jgi:hypothetical protein
MTLNPATLMFLFELTLVFPIFTLRDDNMIPLELVEILSNSTITAFDKHACFRQTGNRQIIANHQCHFTKQKYGGTPLRTTPYPETCQLPKP